MSQDRKVEEIEWAWLVGKTIARVESFIYPHGIGQAERDSAEPDESGLERDADAIRIHFSDGTAVRLFASYDDSQVHAERYAE